VAPNLAIVYWGPTLYEWEMFHDFPVADVPQLNPPPISMKIQLPIGRQAHKIQYAAALYVAIAGRIAGPEMAILAVPLSGPFLGKLGEFTHLGMVENDLGKLS